MDETIRDQAASSVPTMHRSRWTRRSAPPMVLLPVGAAIAYVLAYDPTDQVVDPAGPCWWHMVFGVDGPGCGGTRMLWYLLHGDVVRAGRHHLLALIAVPFLAYGFAAWMANWSFGVGLPQWRASNRLIVVYLVAFVLYSVVLRNLPWAPFNWFYVDDLA